MSWEVLSPTSSPCREQEKSRHRELDPGDTAAHKMHPLWILHPYFILTTLESGYFKQYRGDLNPFLSDSYVSSFKRFCIVQNGVVYICDVNLELFKS